MRVFAYFAFFSCSKKSDNHLPEDNSHGGVTFTAHGEDVTCMAIYNEAIFQKTFSANYKRTDYKILIMQGKDKDAPVHHESNIVLEMITTGGLAKGTYPFIDEEDLGSYYSHRFVRADRCTLQRRQTTGRYRDYSR